MIWVRPSSHRYVPPARGIMSLKSRTHRRDCSGESKKWVNQLPSLHRLVIISRPRGGAYKYECVHVPVSKILWFYCFLESVQRISWCPRCLHDRKRRAHLSILPGQSLQSDYPRTYHRASDQCGPHHPPPHLWNTLIVTFAYERPMKTCSHMAPHAFGAASGHGISRCFGIRNFSSSHVLGSSLSYPSRIHTSEV